jgi:hypothetical protein
MLDPLESMLMYKIFENSGRPNLKNIFVLSPCDSGTRSKHQTKRGLVNKQPTHTLHNPSTLKDFHHFQDSSSPSPQVAQAKAPAQNEPTYEALGVKPGMQDWAGVVLPLSVAIGSVDLPISAGRWQQQNAPMS